MTRTIFIAGFLFLSGFAAFAQTIEQTQAANSSSKPLAILTQPRPNYTDIARRKDVDGVVKLRVVFQADGDIGEIIDVTTKKRKKLEKYGLIARAIEAAKKIKFTPAMENGQPKTVVKLVEYHFNVY
jgi:outer membrane biosynthesis protein TonB